MAIELQILEFLAVDTLKNRWPGDILFYLVA